MIENGYDDLTVVIPVREGSTRVKNKIFLPFGDNSNLTEWKINQLLKVQRPDRIVLSSNSQNIKAVARNMGVNYHEREEYLSVGHQATFSEVIKGIVKDIETQHFAWVTVVVPLMKPADYKEAFDTYFDLVLQDSRYDSLFSANLIKEYLWDDEKPVNYEANKNHTISQDLPNIYRVTNGLYMRDKKSTLSEGYFLGKKPYKQVVSKAAGIDIDEWEDYELSRAMHNFYEE